MKRMLFIALIATVGLAGSAYGAQALTGAQIKDGTITGRDVRNKSLTPADFTGSVQGPQGPAGPQDPPDRKELPEPPGLARSRA